MHTLWNARMLLVVIIIVAAFFRLWQLGEVPAGLHEDEAAYGYNAYALLQTGRDEHGEFFPLVLKSFGEYKPALYAYLTIPWVAIFDLTPFAVRLTSALFGIFSVIICYFLARKLFANKKIALLSSLVLALSPWHITLSRTVSEVVVSVFFILLLLYALFSLREKFKLLWLVVAVLSGLLAVESYTAARFFVVMITALTFLFTLEKVKYTLRFNKTILCLCILFIGLGIFISRLDSVSRFNQVSIISTPETKLVLEEQIREDRLTHPLVTRFFHNKVINYSRTFLQNYDDYFTFDYLFLNGGVPKRVDIPQSGLFYLWQFPFFLFGIYVILRKKLRNGFFLLAWWLILLFPAAMTFDEVPNVYRSLIVLPPLLMITAIGLYESFFFAVRKHSFFIRIAIVVLAIIALGEIAAYQHQYYVHQELNKPWYRGYAYKELTETLEELSAHYDEIVITRGHSGAYISLLFYRNYDPQTYQQEGSPAYEGFDIYTFVTVDCSLNGGKDGKMKVNGKTGVLYVDRGDCVMPKKDVKLIKTIYWQDGNPAYKLLEYIPPKKATPEAQLVN